MTKHAVMTILGVAVVVVALGGIVVTATQALGVALPAECVDVATAGLTAQCAGALNTPGVLRGVAAGLTAIVIHALKKSNPHT